MALEFVLSSIPGPSLPTVDVDYSDKILHAAMYAGIAGALALALGDPRRRRAGLVVALAAAIATAYGVTDELHQILTPNRDASIDDVVADAAGALIGAAIACWLVYRRRRDAHP